MRLRTFGVLLLMPASLGACAAVWGFDDGEPTSEGWGGYAGIGGTTTQPGGFAPGGATATTTTLGGSGGEAGWGGAGGAGGSTSNGGSGASGGSTPSCTNPCNTPPNAECWEPTGTCNPQDNSCTYTPKANGTTCAATTCGGWSACSYPGECAASGTQTRSCTDYGCQGGDCVPSTRQESQGCTRTVANGTPCSAGYCCSNSCVSRGSTNNCGSCGVNCGSRQCVALIGQPGQYSCNCLDNPYCQAAGFGSLATCWNDGNQSACNCQCPNNAASCTGQCAGGGICADITGHNYCHY